MGYLGIFPHAKELVLNAIEKRKGENKADAEERVRVAREALREAQELIRNNPLNTDPQKLAADVQRAVFEAERIGGSGTDRRKTALSILSELGYDTRRSLADDGTQYGDLIAHSVDTQVLSLYLGVYEIERGLKKRAENSEEFRAKYGRKRFTSSNAGRSIIYSYLYWGYLKNEGLTNDELREWPLYNSLNAIRNKIETVDDEYVYIQFIQFEGWLASAFEAALFMRNGVKSVLAHFHSIVTGVIAAEGLREELGEKANEKNTELWLSLLSVDSIMPTMGTYETLRTLRANIDSGLRYLNVYNTLIDTIGSALDIPELTLFQVRMSIVGDAISQLNEALVYLRDKIVKKMMEQGLHPASPLAALQEALRDVSPDAPPIPEANIKETERKIRDTVIVNGNIPWTNLIPTLSKGYWRR